MSSSAPQTTQSQNAHAPGFDPDALRVRYREERDKRVRDDGNAQYVEVKGRFAHYLDDPYAEPGFARAPLTDEVEVVVVGGGFGGLLAGARLRQAGVENLRMIDPAGDFGGTWYWNRYPGIACDIESYTYLPLLEELGYMPKEKYSFGPEILAHSQNIARKFDLYRDALFQTRVEALRWDEARSRWIIRTNRGDEFCEIVHRTASATLLNPRRAYRHGDAQLLHSILWLFQTPSGEIGKRRRVGEAKKVRTCFGNMCGPFFPF